jgi:hypothetical protein
MVQIPPPPDSAATHFFWIAVPVILSTAAGQIITFLANKARGDEKDRKRAIEEAEKEERAAVLLANYPLHQHTESRGQLRAENIRFPR